jgi:hypothetical protein
MIPDPLLLVVYVDFQAFQVDDMWGVVDPHGPHV